MVLKDGIYLDSQKYDGDRNGSGSVEMSKILALKGYVRVHELSKRCHLRVVLVQVIPKITEDL